MLIDDDLNIEITPSSGGYEVRAGDFKIWTRDPTGLKFIDNHLYDGIKEYSHGHWHITFRSIYHFIKRG